MFDNHNIDTGEGTSQLCYFDNEPFVYKDIAIIEFGGIDGFRVVARAQSNPFPGMKFLWILLRACLTGSPLFVYYVASPLKLILATFSFSSSDFSLYFIGKAAVSFFMILVISACYFLMAFLAGLLNIPIFFFLFFRRDENFFHHVLLGESFAEFFLLGVQVAELCFSPSDISVFLIFSGTLTILLYVDELFVYIRRRVTTNKSSKFDVFFSRAMTSSNNISLLSQESQASMDENYANERIERLERRLKELESLLRK